jgi:hypothetical protein
LRRDAPLARREEDLMHRLAPLPRACAVLAIALLVTSSVASAQVSPELVNSTPQERAKLLTLEMKEKLALTPEQLPKVEAINLEAAQKMEPVLKGSDKPLVKRRTSQLVEQAKESALQGVLTPPQFQQYLASREEMKQKVGQKLREKRAQTPPQ